MPGTVYTFLFASILLAAASPVRGSTVTGRVVDAESGRPVAGVTVRSGDSAVTADANGAFTIDASGPVSFTRIGYAGRTLSPPFPDPLTVRLDPAPIPLDAVGVTRRRHSAASTAREPSFTTVIDRTDFEGSVTSLPDVIDRTVGVRIRSLGGTGTFSTVSVRGASSEQVDVYLDGVLLNAAVGGGVNLANLPLAHVGRIEITRGGGQDGNGLGGTVQIRTRDAETGTVDVNGSWGSFDTRGLTVFATRTSGRARYLAVLDYASSDNDFGFLDDNGTEFNLDDDTFTERRNNHVRSGSVLGKAAVDLGSARTLSISQTLSGKRQGIPGISNNQSTRAHLSGFRSVTQAQFEDRDLGGLATTRQTLTFSHVGESFVDSLGEIGIGRQDNAYRTRVWGHDSLTRLPIANRHLLSFQTDVRRETYDPEAAIRLITPLFAARRWAWRARLTADLSFLDDRLAWTGAVDLRHLRNRYEGRNPFAFSPTAPDSVSTHDFVGLHTGLRADLVGPVTVKANLARSRRAPSFHELFGDRGGVVGNTSLSPERGLSVDAGIRLDVRRAWLEAVWFDQRYDDLIQFTQTSQATSRPVNAGRARVHGIEASGHVSLDRRLAVSGRYVRQASEDRSAVPHLRGNALPGRPRHRAGLRADLSLGRASFSHDYAFESGNFLDQANRRRLEARHIHTASVRYTVRRGLTLGLNGRNLTDTRATDVLGYPLPGRAWFVSCSTRWD